MPPRVPGFTITGILLAFRNDGWTIRQGSRHSIAEKDGRRVPIPRHPGRDIAPGTMGSIIALADWTVADFRSLVRRRNRSAK